MGAVVGAVVVKVLVLQVDQCWVAGMYKSSCMVVEIEDHRHGGVHVVRLQVLEVVVQHMMVLAVCQVMTDQVEQDLIL